jgi:hypothetical protein
LGSTPFPFRTPPAPNTPTPNNTRSTPAARRSRASTTTHHIESAVRQTRGEPRWPRKSSTVPSPT